MVTFEIQAVTINKPTTGRGIDFRMEKITKNKLHTVTSKIPRILVQQLQIYPFLPFDRASGLFHNGSVFCILPSSDNIQYPNTHQFEYNH
jgi:hypothetical protein